MTLRPLPRLLRAAGVVALLGVVGCGAEADGPTAVTAETAAGLPWDEVIERARGTTVTWRLWRGDPSINAYVDEWVAPRLRERFGIELRTVQGQGAEIVNQLAVERDARADGITDLVWINGETFDNLIGAELLWGPWADGIPNAELVDRSSPIVMTDFERPLNGMESPWGRVQFAFIHSLERTPDPPRTVDELGAWIKANPGRFTHDQSFTGVTFLKTLLYALNGGVEPFQGGFDEEAYERGSAPVWSWLEEHTPYFWREGRTYPNGVAELHRLFANREIDFSMSNNENEALTKARQGVLPDDARPFLLREGTIANAHYVAIPFNAPNPLGAMVVADFLLSPEAQREKADPAVWGDGTVLDPERLPAEWAERFRALSPDGTAIPADTLRRYAVPEVAPEYHERLEAEWRARIRPAGE